MKTKSQKQVMLTILDGFGHSDRVENNAIKAAQTPNLDKLFSDFPFTTIIPGGEEVGLPKGVAGNSEVGHMNLGAGRPVRQDLVRINEAIKHQTFEQLDKFKELISKTKQGSKRIHLMGLLSDGGVHSHIDHIQEVISYLSKNDFTIFFHAFMDGRDTNKEHGIRYIKQLSQTSGFIFASMQGRSIGMDRDRRWEKIKHCYQTLVGDGLIEKTSPTDYISKQYREEIFDEFITPVLFSKDYAIENDDTIFFLNFRPDRAKQITTAFCDPQFSEFTITKRPSYFLCMTAYVQEDLPQVPILIDKEKIKMTLSEFLSSQGLKQFKIAETEKYAHITYFFNGGEETPFPNEEQFLINSPKDVETYDLKPEMSAPEVYQELSQRLDQEDYSFYLVNFANPDMVGHTGNFEAAVKAIEYIDDIVGKLADQCLKNDIAMIITADHGNADQMTYEDGNSHTSHSKAPVPCCLVSKNEISRVNNDKALKDVAPTILHLLGLTNPPEFTGQTIFEQE